MPHFWLFVLFFFAAVPLYDLATPVVPWDDMKIKHTWNFTPVNWETLGHPSAGSTIDINIVLKPDRESAPIDAVSEISDPKHSRHPPHHFSARAFIHMCLCSVQISRIPFQGTS